MTDSGHYHNDASYDHPASLVFGGLLYDKTMTPIDHHPCVNFPHVTAYQEQQDGDMDVDDDFVNGNGPEIVGFKKFLYQRSDVDPALIEDGALRTVAVNTPVEPLQQVAIAALAPANYVLDAQVSVQVSYPRANGPPVVWYLHPPPGAQVSIQVAPQQFTDPPPNWYPYPPPKAQVRIPSAPQQIINRVPRVMPPRAPVTQISALEPLFDLEPEERVGVAYVVPSPNNVAFPVTPGMIANPRRTHWKREHTAYLDELMELAMLKLNRPLHIKDFKAITEALHRHFRTNGGIPERGYNTVHSYGTRKRGYHSLVQRVLPGIGFPEYVD